MVITAAIVSVIRPAWSLSVSHSRACLFYTLSRVCRLCLFKLPQGTGAEQIITFAPRTLWFGKVIDGVSDYYNSRAFPTETNQIAESNSASLPLLQLGAAHNARGADEAGKVRSVARCLNISSWRVGAISCDQFISRFQSVKCWHFVNLYSSSREIVSRIPVLPRS